MGLCLVFSIDMLVLKFVKWKIVIEMVGIGGLLLVMGVGLVWLWLVSLVVLWFVVVFVVYMFGFYVGVLIVELK